MKKLLFCLLAACTLISCSDDKDDDSYLSNVPDDEVAYIQVRVDANMINTPNSFDLAWLFLFHIDDKDVDENIIPHIDGSYSNRLCYIEDKNEEVILCDYTETFLREKDENGTLTMKYVDVAFSPNILSATSTTNFKRGKYLVVIYMGDSYFCHYETIDPKEKYAELHYNLVQTETSGIADRYIWF